MAALIQSTLQRCLGHMRQKPSGPSNLGAGPALQKVPKWRREGGLTGRGLGETSGQSAAKAPAFITKTNSTSGASSLPRSLAHLIRGTSIISSSNPHELTVKGEREAAPAGVHRVRAVCWPQGPGASQRQRPHKGDCAFIPVPRLPHPHPSAPAHAPAPRVPAGRSASTAPRGTQAAAAGSARRAPRCLTGIRMPALPSLAPRRPPRRGTAPT